MILDSCVFLSDESDKEEGGEIGEVEEERYQFTEDDIIMLEQPAPETKVSIIFLC